jgi:DNA-binding HxlR family transcriptional regulator
MSVSAPETIGRPPLPASAFKLLGRPRHVAILRRLADGANDAAALRTDVAAPVATLYDDLHRLEHAGVLQRKAGAKRQTWSLTVAGRQLRHISVVAKRLARGIPCPSYNDDVIAAFCSVLADERTLLLVRTVLVDGPGRPSELERRLQGRMTHRGLHERLAALVACGVLTRATQEPRRYCFEPAWRPLAALLLLGNRWDWTWGTIAHPTLTGDAVGLLALVAPLVRLPLSVQGRCRVIVDHASALEPETIVGARRGSLVIERDGSARLDADATARATPRSWHEALVSRRLAALSVEGRVDLVHDLVDAVGKALFARLGRR